MRPHVLEVGDQLGIVLQDVSKGSLLLDGVTAVQDISKNHKVALKDIRAGSVVRKFGQPIGVAQCDIDAGSWVHVHNLGFSTDLGALGQGTESGLSDDVIPERRTFMGYRRANGKVGTRNYVGIIASVNCSATVCRAIASRAERALADRFPDIDGFVPITHDSGCGIAMSGEPFEILKRTINGYIQHPNFAAVVLVGLGCEVNQIKNYAMSEAVDDRRLSLNIQDAGGTSETIKSALGLIEEMCINISASEQREEVSVEHLVLGLQCGGSDGLSGITANPALGRATDYLVAAGGTAILSETPEIFGAESLLISRSSSEVAYQLRACLDWWLTHSEQNQVSLDNNPSPGNKAGGLTTILEKSLGAVSKAGATPLRAFYKYAETVEQAGLVFMDTPGYDPVSATGQVAGGANVVAFTTGRGSCFGSRPAPCIKLASSTDLYQRMQDDMDIDCGQIISAATPMDEMGLQIYHRLLDVASGERSKSEELGYGDNEFVPWRFGAVL
ncbi:MAG TPA: galactonate dehydratase [Thalassospira sp.]|nr:galactonate dehydratase [Thalassospira sp.]